MAIKNATAAPTKATSRATGATKPPVCASVLIAPPPPHIGTTLAPPHIVLQMYVETLPPRIPATKKVAGASG